MLFVQLFVYCLPLFSQEAGITTLVFNYESLSQEKRITLSPKIVRRVKSEKDGLFVYRSGPKERNFPYTGIDGLSVVADEDIYLLNNGAVVHLRTDVNDIEKY